MTPIEAARQSLEYAVRKGLYTEARRCLEEYASAVNNSLAMAGRDSPGAAETVASALDLLHWADRAVRSGRAHAAGRLSRLASARPYRAASPQPAATFRLEA